MRWTDWLYCVGLSQFVGLTVHMCVSPCSSSCFRVYVEDAEGRLVGVVSIRDVCGEVLARFEDATRK